MPYPASPPEPPALITVSSKAVAYSKSAPKEASEPHLTHPPNQTAPFHPVVAPVIAVVAQPEATALPTTADFLQQRGASKAELLVPATTTSYFLNDAPQAPGLGGEAQQPPEQKQKFSFKVNPAKEQGKGITDIRSSAIESIAPRSLTVPTPPSIARDFFTADRAPTPATASTASPSVVYSLSGTTRQADQAGEAAVMSGLNTAIELDEFAAETLAQEKAGTPDSPGLGIRAQAPGEPTLLLPIPTLDQPTANPIPAPIPTPTQVPDQQEPPTALPPTQRVPANRSLPSPGAVSSVGSVIELTADRQEYDEQRKIFTAEGKVLMRFQGALLDADRLQVNLENRLAVAEGNVALTRGNQVLRGQRLEYSFVQGTGAVLNARGEIFVGDTEPSLAVGRRGDNEGVTIARPVSDRVTAAQPTQNVSSPGGLSLGVGFGRDISRVAGGVPLGGQVRRLRFEAERIDFTPEGWVAKNIQITNDPFSPPELVLKADAATFKRLSPLRDEVRTTHPRLVFDQHLTLPILVPKIVLDRRQRSPAVLRFGYDDEERGGLFVERTFEILTSPNVRFTLTPQIFLQKAIFGDGSPFRSSTARTNSSNNGPLSAENFGLKAGLEIRPGPFTSIRGRAALTSLDLTDVENNLRASLRARQLVGTHILALEYSYRDRLFNGSLGFQTVQSSLGAVLLSPKILLGQSGIELTYQAGFQYVNAETDRLSLLSPDRTNNRIDLGRFEGAVRLYRAITLWQGKTLPATPAEGLRYSPVPLRPYVNLSLEGRAVASAYTSGDSQQNLIASVGLSGQFGHFSRKFLDYTAFNISYTQLIGGGQSPFFFDRAVDNRILNLGIVQQVYGPLRVGFQTSINLDSSNQFSTDYILEYRRRTYAVVLRYNPVLAIGAIGFQISDFNWTGGTDTFEGADITPVEGGVILRRDE